MNGLQSEPLSEQITGEGELVGDEQHELRPHELEGTPRGGGDSGVVPMGVAGVAQGAAEEEPHCGGGGGDGHEEQEEEHAVRSTVGAHRWLNACGWRRPACGRAAPAGARGGG